MIRRPPRSTLVPYTTLFLSLMVVTDPGTGRPTVGVLEKGLSALESLLFAKYQMYRNVYWHHAVRSATCMFKRAVRIAVRQGLVTAEIIAESTDDALMELLIRHEPNGLAAGIRARRLHKRALDLPASEVTGQVQPWVTADPDLL